MSDNKKYACIIAYSFEGTLLEEKLHEVHSVKAILNGQITTISITEYLKTNHDIRGVTDIFGNSEHFKLSSRREHEPIYINFLET